MQDELVTFETQHEMSATSGKSETRIFLKMYVGAVKHGLVADMGVRNWTTLCVIASYMTENGECYPTQSQIASGLGISRQTASKYVNGLVKYRWNGRPIIKAVRKRDEHSGQWENTRYTVLPISQIAIFNGKVEPM